VCVRLSFAPCAEAPSAGVPLAPPPPGKLLGDDRLAEWRQVHRRLWAHVHTAVGPHDITAELNRRMQVQRTKQRDAYSRSIASFARSAADGSARPLRAATQLIKVVPIELFTPEPDWPAEDHRRVVQTRPKPGGPGRLGYIHAPGELLTPLEAFAAWHVGFAFSMDELPARNSFLRACAVRSLLSLGVVEIA